MVVIRWGEVRRQVADPGLLITFVGATAVLVLFVLYPAFRVLVYPSLQDYLAIPQSLRWIHAARNSLVMMVISTLTATLVGLLFAFVITRPDVPGRRFFRNIAMLPLFALCDRNDIGGVSTPLHPDTGLPQIFIYDAYPGGIGIAEKGFELIEELWQATLATITECPCQEGCPSCIQSPKCGNNNKPLDKLAARLLLEGLVGKDK